MQKTIKAFYLMKALVAEKFPQADKIKLFFGCPDTEYDHKCSSRQYAHALHLKNIICVCQAFEKLPTKNKFGIFLHEFGHILGSPDEDKADDFIEKHFKIYIAYTGRKELQEV
jgi:hypothetical protein